MSSWNQGFAAFEASQRNTDLDFYRTRLAYEASVLSLYNDHDRVSRPERAAREAAMAALYQDLASTRRQSRFLLPAVAVLWLRNPDNWQRLGATQVAKPDLIQRLETLLQADPAGADNPYWLILQGILAHIRQHEETACRLLHQAAVMPSYSETVPCSLRGAALAKPLPDIQTLRACANTLSESPIQLDRKDTRVSAQPYLSFCGDPIYFEAFARSILESLIATGALAQNLHFHVVRSAAADSDADAVIASLARRCAEAGYSLAVTSEHQSGADRTYFASARFLRAQALLQMLGHPILMSDMDVEFTRDPTPHLKALSRRHVAIMASQGPYWGFLPWRQFWAGHIFFPDTPAGHDFAGLLQNAICYLWRPEKHLTWWVDQYALWLAWHMMAAIGYGDAFRPIGHVDYMASGETFKIEGLKRVKAIAQRMADGQNWSEATSAHQEERAAAS